MNERGGHEKRRYLMKNLTKPGFLSLLEHQSLYARKNKNNPGFRVVFKLSNFITYVRVKILLEIATKLNARIATAMPTMA